MGIPRRAFLATGVAVAGGYAAARGWHGPTPTFAAGNVGTIMAMRPGWLPDGVVENHRISSVGTGRFHQTRSWIGDGHSVSLEIGRARGPGPDAEHLVVAGVPMWIDREFDDLCSIWRAAGAGLEANVSVTMPKPRDGAGRIASSLVPDGQTVCEVAMRFGWLPGTTPPDGFVVEMRHAPGQPLSQVLYSHDSALGPARAWAIAGPTESAVLNDISQLRVTDPVTVRGRPGRCAFSSPSGRVVVELSAGKWLCVNVDGFHAPLGRDDLLRVTETMWIGDVPPWRK